jgi:carbon monoxide dehydrogenase subunit G
MEMTGEHRINLPQDLVWRALNDPEVLKASIPGCEELVRDGDTRFKGRVAASVGPVRAKFSGEAVLSDIDPPNGYVLTGSGSGGAAGMAKGSAAVRLTTDGEVTVLRYEAKAQVAGKLAQIGARLVDMAAKKMADEFFANFAAQLEPRLADASEEVLEAALEPASAPMPDFAPAPIPAPVPDAAKTSSQARPGWLVWAAIAVLAVIVVAVYLVAR